jgi:hypothetical protein
LLLLVVLVAIDAVLVASTAPLRNNGFVHPHKAPTKIMDKMSRGIHQLLQVVAVAVAVPIDMMLSQLLSSICVALLDDGIRLSLLE